VTSYLQATQNEALRVALGTVPGTVREAVWKAYYDAIWTAIIAGTVRAYRRSICRRTSGAIVVAICRVTGTRTCRGTVAAICGLDFTAVWIGTAAVVLEANCRGIPAVNLAWGWGAVSQSRTGYSHRFRPTKAVAVPLRTRGAAPVFLSASEGLGHDPKLKKSLGHVPRL